MISVTEEAVFYDQTLELLNRCRGIGEKARLHKEKRIVYGIQDIAGYKSYYPEGVQTDMYSSDIGNLATTNAFGEAGVNAVFKLMHGMKDEAGDEIYVPKSRMNLLLPMDLYIAGRQMNESVLIPEGNENAKNVLSGAWSEVLTSPYITNQSPTTWFTGDFKKAAVWTEVFPLQTFTQKQGSDDLFTKDLAARYKVRYMGNLSIVMPEYIFKSTT